MFLTGGFEKHKKKTFTIIEYLRVCSFDKTRWRIIFEKLNKRLSMDNRKKDNGKKEKTN